MASQKVVKPTPKEEVEINRRLEKMYPGRQYKIKKGLKARMAEALGVGGGGRSKQLDQQLRKGGLTEAEIRRLGGGR